MKKVLIIENHGNRGHGGAEKSMAGFGDYLLAQGIQVVVASDYFTTYFQNDEEATYELLCTDPLIITKPWDFLSSIIKLIKIVNRHKPDLIFTHTIHAFPLIRIVAEITNVRTAVIFKWIYSGNSIGKLNTWGLKGINQIIALNPYVGNYWSNILKKSKINIQYVPDGVHFKNNLKRSNSRSEQWKLLYIGRITPNKGLHVLIDVVQKLRNKVSLSVLGVFNPKTDSYHRKLEQIVKTQEMKNVKFEGFCKSVEDHILASDLVIVPSISPEAQPFAILESIANKTAVIASKIGGVPYTLQDDFWMFEPDSASSLMEKINQVFEINQEELQDRIEKVYKWTKEHYNVLTTQKKLLDLLNNG